eukprot:1793291-Alexandrium_andersonii.AAC.1
MAAGFVFLSSSRSDAGRSFGSSDKPRSAPVSRSVPVGAQDNRADADEDHTDGPSGGDDSLDE